jgi:hypothetical protein
MRSPFDFMDRQMQFMTEQMRDMDREFMDMDQLVRRHWGCWQHAALCRCHH